MVKKIWGFKAVLRKFEKIFVKIIFGKLLTKSYLSFEQRYFDKISNDSRNNFVLSKKDGDFEIILGTCQEFLLK